MIQMKVESEYWDQKVSSDAQFFTWYSLHFYLEQPICPEHTSPLYSSFGLHFAFRNNHFWLICEATYLHRETNDTYIVFEVGWKWWFKLQHVVHLWSSRVKVGTQIAQHSKRNFGHQKYQFSGFNAPHFLIFKNIKSSFQIIWPMLQVSV